MQVSMAYVAEARWQKRALQLPRVAMKVMYIYTYMCIYIYVEYVRCITCVAGAEVAEVSFAVAHGSRMS